MGIKILKHWRKEQERYEEELHKRVEKLSKAKRVGAPN